MKTKKRNYYNEYLKLEKSVAKDLKVQLKRLKRSFNTDGIGEDDEDEILEFFTFKSSENIEEIFPNGTAKVYGIEEPIDLGSLIDNEDIPLLNAIALLEELTNLKKTIINETHYNPNNLRWSFTANRFNR